MIGTVISHYKVLEKLGAGAMGVVYKAEDLTLGRLVALKFLPPQCSANDEEKKRFIQEARAASGLDHPNICTVHEIGESQFGQMFIVMACYDGETLDKIIKRGALAIEDGIDIGLQIASGLAKAHSHRIIHRDLKPANVIVTTDGVVKILDFGLAKLGSLNITPQGTTLGTPAYMSPEQVLQEKVDERTDIWSLGVVLYEALTGKLPFDGTYHQALAFSIVNEDPTSMLDLREDVPSKLDWLIRERALAKNATDRLPGCKELARELQTIRNDTKAQSKPLEAKAGTAPRIPPAAAESRIGSRLNRRWRSVGVAALLSLLLVAVSLLVVRVAPLGEPENVSLGAVPNVKRLAILRFQSQSGDRSSQALCDGLLDVIASQLTASESFHDTLAVFPASEILQRDIRTPSQARKEFGANLAVAGTVLFEDDRLRLVLNLINLDDMRQVGSKIINGSTADLRKLESEVVASLTSMLGLQYPLAEAAQPGAPLSPAHPGGHEFYLQGRGYLTRYDKTVENVDTAINLFKQAVHISPQDALALSGLCEAYWRKYRYAKDHRWVQLAAESCKQALILDGNLAPVHVTQGLVHAGTGEHEKAAEDYRRALELDPRDAGAYYGLGLAYQSLGLFEKAEAILTKAIEVRPESWLGYDHLGRFYYSRGRYADAVEQLRHVVRLTPDNARGYLNLGAVLYYVEDFDQARAMFEKSIEIEPQFRALGNLGELYFQDGRDKEAIQIYKQALVINDREHTLWGNLGDVYLTQPETSHEARVSYEKAAELVSKALEINPDSAEELSFLALYRARLGYSGDALDLITKAVEQPDATPNEFLRAGEVCELLNHRKAAIGWVLKAISLGYSVNLVGRKHLFRELLKDPELESQLLKLGLAPRMKVRRQTVL